MIMDDASKTQIIYKLDGIDSEYGVDVFEIAPILMHFGELIKAGNEILGSEQKIDIRIKPFRQGSWITEFIIQNNITQTLLDHLKNPNGQDIMLLLAFLGLGAKDGVTGVAKIIRRTKGLVNNFRKNDNGTVTYTQPDGTTFTVTMPEHKLVQSPLIQNNYYNCVIAPLDKFPAATAVSVGGNDDNPAEKFTEEDRDAFNTYANAELLEDVDINTTTMSSIFLKPKRGSYNGEEKAYSFILGENNVLWPVTIEDTDFLGKMKSGEVRLYTEDVLKVDIEVRQKRDSSNRILTQYAITAIHDYIRFEKPKQLSMDDVFNQG